MLGKLTINTLRRKIFKCFKLSGLFSCIVLFCRPNFVEKIYSNEQHNQIFDSTDHYVAMAVLWCGVSSFSANDTGNVIPIKKTNTSSLPKDDVGITASISGHTLSVNFANAIGLVDVEVSNSTGTVQSFAVVTPDNVQTYITASGSYTVTFTLSNGDEYYGNFVVF